MNNLKNALMAAAVFFSLQVSAQVDQKTAARLVENQNLVFNATAAYPLASADINAVLSQMPGGQTGAAIQLSGSRYQLIVEKENLEAYLPYYGRAYTSSRDPLDSGIKFNTKDFSYDAKKKKKGNWIIVIKPKNDRDVQSLTLNVSQTGYATLSVVSNTRQTITFNGYIQEPEKKAELSK